MPKREETRPDGSRKEEKEAGKVELGFRLRKRVAKSTGEHVFIVVASREEVEGYLESLMSDRAHLYPETSRSPAPLVIGGATIVDENNEPYIVHWTVVGPRIVEEQP
jgi:hypothetical protein